MSDYEPKYRKCMYCGNCVHKIDTIEQREGSFCKSFSVWLHRDPALQYQNAGGCPKFQNGTPGLTYRV